jgi:hypothetical protein
MFLPVYRLFILVYRLSTPRQRGWRTGVTVGSEFAPEGVLPPLRAGKTCNGKSSKAVFPAATQTSTIKGGLKLLRDGTMLAKPFTSVIAVLCPTCRTTGAEGFTGFVSPSPTPGDVSPGLRTVV